MLKFSGIPNIVRKPQCLAHQGAREKLRRKIGGFYTLYSFRKYKNFSNLETLYNHFFRENNIWLGSSEQLQFIAGMVQTLKTTPNRKVLISDLSKINALYSIHIKV